MPAVTGNGSFHDDPDELDTQARAPSPRSSLARPRVAGKFLFVGDEKLYVRGVTYGTFRPSDDGHQFPERADVERDFALMAANGINTVRVYTAPPRWLLDVAQNHRLRVMVGTPWEQHVAFLNDKGRASQIVERVREQVRSCAGHPAVFCYAIGNEIPASIVRWYGPRRIERFIHRLYRAAKAEDPDALVTYVNFPSTEYLNLPFLDVASFNVYLEDPDRFDSYLAHLHNWVGERPLLMAEVGLDSSRHGQCTQANAIEAQARTAFAAGCAGVFVFAWTDEWYRGGHDVEDWDFGLTDRTHRPKPALDGARRAFAEVPFPAGSPWPRISVVVCTYNGARTIRDCLEGLKRLDYPDFEVILVDDGSTDGTATIVREYGFRVISTENRGLSSARNTGLEVATGEIVAYTDDDARPDPHWLTYLAAAFMDSDADYAGVGGPNLAPAGDGPIAECVANAPGGPVHVLLDDREAEHIPGCNMAFRKDRLTAIGGFDPQFRSAGDDVDVCWRLQARGWRLGFSPAATVWHHRRNSVREYWKQQIGYGKAEALLEQKWPEKYNSAGHVTWTGRLYGNGLTRALGRTVQRIYHGSWGTAPFQSVYQPATGVLSSLPLMPEWYQIIVMLAALSTLGLFWTPMLLAVPLCAIAIGASIAQAVISAGGATFASATARSRPALLGLRSMTAALHLLQPLARLRGRVRHGLSFWRRRSTVDLLLPGPHQTSVWSEVWRAPEDWLHAIEEGLRRAGAVAVHGGQYDSWDLEIRGGMMGGARVTMAVEEHGDGRQLVRFGLRPLLKSYSVALTLVLGALALGAVVDQAWPAAGILIAASFAAAGRMVVECALAMGAA
ncbi:MAG: glycosyl transferase, family 2 [Chloroflexi bacterium]|nr:glycosyl transferase, family 2 [Chloroflexota bacterium]